MSHILRTFNSAPITNILLVRVGILLASSASVCAAAMNLPLEATKNFLADSKHVGWKAMYQGSRLVALYGRGDPLPGGKTVEQFVNEYVASADNLAAYGIAGGQLDFKDNIELGNGKTVYRYTQYNPVEFLPVHGGTAKVVMWNGDHSVQYIGLNLAAQNSEAARLPGDVFTEQQAKDSISANCVYSAQGIASFDSASKVVVEDKLGTLHRAWRFNGWGGNSAYLFFVDTYTGKLIAAQNQILGDDVHVQGHVTGHATPGYGPYTGSVSLSQT